MVAKLQRPGQPAAAPATQSGGWGAPQAQPVGAPQPQQGAPNGGWLPPSGNTALPPAATGWGAPTPTQAPDDQRQRMQAMLTGEDPHADKPSPAQQAQAAFSGAVGDARQALADTDYDAPAPQQAPSGWGAPAPAQAAPAGQRQPGQPSPGKARRTKAEMEEDAAWEAQNAQPVQAAALSTLDTPEGVAFDAAVEVVPGPAGRDKYLSFETMRCKLEVLKLVFADPATDFDGGMDAAREMWAFVSDV